MFDDSGYFNQKPPSNQQAEMALLGALLGNNRCLDACARLEPRHFSDEGLGVVYQAVREGIEAGRRVDAVSLRGGFDSTLLASLLAAFVAPEVVPEYARVIRETAQQRELIDACRSVLDRAYADRDPAAALATELATKLDRIAHGDTARKMTTLGDAIAQVMAEVEGSAQSNAISTGFRCLDERLGGGLEPGLVYVIAGRPGMGKSALAHQVCINAALAGTGVLEISLEMRAKQLARRAMAIASKIPMVAMKPGLSAGTAGGLVQAQQQLAGLPVYIDDAAAQTPSMIAATAREVRRRHGIGLLMIDHLNLMRAEDADARHGGTWAVGRASNTVLQIAKDCDCPVILCVQLNRGPEQREDKRPNLADLRQSGDIEQDAYAVGFVYRPEYYLGAEPERRQSESPASFATRLDDWNEHRDRVAGLAEIVWGKVRDGEPGVDRLGFNGPTTTFREVGP